MLGPTQSGNKKGQHVVLSLPWNTFIDSALDSVLYAALDSAIHSYLCPLRRSGPLGFWARRSS
jgi:hypothetical protein